MSCKYDIIDEGGRKRVRALRHFTVQGRDVCPMELGGYVYDEKTLSQDGNCWIFSGSLEYPGVRVMDEAIVDMGINLASPVTARPKSVVISGNSRIMGAIQFTGFESTSQAGNVWEQGAFNAVVGMIPVKGNASIRVRTQAPMFAGAAGKVAITSTAYEARLISLDEAGIIVSVTAWTVGGPAVTLTSTAPYILVEVRKVGDTAITPADITAAGITITRASETSLEITNSSIITLYNGVIADATNIFSFRVFDGKSTVQNSSIRIEAFAASSNTLNFLADFDKVNAIFTPEAGTSTTINGIYIRSNVTAPGNLVATGFTKSRQFVVKDCPEFVWSATVFPLIADFRSSGKVFTFKSCNMPVGSAIHYYDPKVNVWDNIDFTKAMADLGKTLPLAGTIRLGSSNKQGMYRLYDATPKAHGALVESISSLATARISGYAGTYDSIIYKDCAIKGLFKIIGRNVFGGTQDGASQLVNTTATAIEINGSFRIEGNAQVTDTPLKGTGYIGGNAELENGNVIGYIYMDGDSKAVLPVNTANFRRLIMRDNAIITKVRASTALSLIMYGNALLNGEIITGGGDFIMRDNSIIDTSGTVNSNGPVELKDNASITGTGGLSLSGDVKLVGGFNLSAGNQTIYGKRTIADVSEIASVELPPTKTTW